MIVTVLGGSAPSTPQLVDWLAKQQLGVPMTIRLTARDPGRLAAVTRASRVLAQESDLTVQDFSKGKWDEALEGADVVLIQVRTGGLAWRQLDETFPLKFGIPGDEGLGPGGLSAALRNWPVVRDLLERIRRNAASCAAILLTSPGSLLARLAAMEFSDLHVYSVCELPLTTLRDVCRYASRKVEEVEFSYAGVNHLGWLYDLRCSGADVMEEYVRTNAANGLRGVIQAYGAVPLPYLSLHFQPEEAVAEQLRTGSRAARLLTIQHNAIRAFERGGPAEIRQALAARSAPWYTDAVGPLVLNLSGDTTPENDCHVPFFLSTADDSGEVQERPYVAEGGVLRPLPVREAPRAVRELNSRYAAYEKEAAASLQEPDRDKLARALRIHPWVREERTAVALADTTWRGFQTFSETRDDLPWLN